MKITLHFLIYFLVLAIFAPISVFADTFVFSDTEGSTEKIDAYVEQGKLRWVGNGANRRLELANPKDSVVFLGDLSGPNWHDPSNPQNIFLRDTLLDLKNRHPQQVDIVLGNHEYNRLGFVRDNVRIEKGQASDYTKWLASKGLKDNNLSLSLIHI